MARIFQTSTMGEAQIRVAVVTERAQADLLVCRVSSWGEANGDDRWFITREKQDATCWLFFSSIGMAQVKICFIDNQGEAGWQKLNPFKGRFG